MDTSLQEKVTTLLTTTFVETDNQVRKQAEQELDNLQQNPKELINAYLSILSLQDTNIQIKKAVSLRLRDSLQNLRSQGQLELTDRVYLVTQIYQIMKLNANKKPILQILSVVLRSIITQDEKDQEGSCINELYGLIENSSNKQDLTEYPASFKAAYALFTSLFKSSQLDQAINNLMVLSLRVGLGLISQATQAFNTHDSQTFSLHVDLIEQLCNLLVQIFDHIETSAPSIFYNLQNMQILVEFYLGALQLGVDAQDSYISLIQFKRQETLIQLNKAKSCILQCINYNLQYLILNKKKNLEKSRGQKIKTVVGENLPDSVFIQFCVQLAPTIISSSLLFSYQQDIGSFLDYEDIQELYTEKLLFLVKIVPECQFLTLFEPYSKDIISSICIKTLRITPKEFESAQENPGEFVTSSMDICERQELDLPKQAAAQLLESICETIDGSLNFIITLLTHAMDAIFGGILLSELKQYSLIGDYIDKSGLVNSNAEEVIEVCFIIFSIIAYQIFKRRDLLSMIEDVLWKYNQSVINITSPLVLNRICLFMYFFTEYIFVSNKEGFQMLLQILFRCIDISQAPAIAHLQACDTLQFISQDSDIMERLQPFFPDFISFLVSSIQNQDQKEFFVALMHIIKYCISYVNLDLTVLIRQVVAKLQQQILQDNQAKQNSEGIIQARCWDVLKSIANFHSTTEEQLLALESSLVPLYGDLRGTSEVTHHILDLEYLIIKRLNIVTQIGWQIFQNLEQIFKADQGQMVLCIKLINYCVKLGNVYLAENPQLIQCLFSICEYALFTQMAQDQELVNSYGCVIFQIMTENLIGVLNDHLSAMIDLIVRRLSAPIINEFLKTRLFSALLQCFIYNHSIAASKMQSIQVNGLNFYHQLIESVIKNPLIFQQSFDRKIAVQSICQIFIHNLIPVEMVHLTLELFVAMLKILQNTQSAPIVDNNLNSKLIQQLMQYQDSDSDSDNVDSTIQQIIQAQQNIFGSQNNQMQHINKLLSELVTNVHQLDEYDIFRSFMQALKQDMQQFQQLMSQLSNEYKLQIIDVMQFRRVQITQSNESKVRKVLKAKRKS